MAGCSFKRLLCALAFVCGAEAAQAQTWPAYPSNGSYPYGQGYNQAYGQTSGQGYNQAYGQGYPAPPRPYPYYGYGQYATQPGSAPYPNAARPYPYYGYAQYGTQPGYGQYPTAARPYASYGYPQYGTQPGYAQYPLGNYASYTAGYPNYASTYPQSANAASGAARSAPAQGYSYPQTMNGVTGLPPAAAKTTAAGQPAAATAAATDSTAVEDLGGNAVVSPGGPPPSQIASVQPVPVEQVGEEIDDRHEEAAAAAATPKHKFWLSSESTLSFIRPEHLATPLVTTGSLADLVPAALGQPGTAVLFGDNVDFKQMSGIRAEAGIFLDNCDRVSIEGSGFYDFPNHVDYLKASDAAGNPIIARPIFNVVAGQEAAFVDAFPGLAAGGVRIDARTQLFGSELNARYHFYPTEHWSGDLMAGFRYLRLAESLAIQDQLTPLVDNTITFEGNFVNAPDVLGDIDQFRTTNNFYGLQLGGRLRWECNRFFVSPWAKVGAGTTEQDVTISGSTTLTGPNGTQAATGGILALPTNIGDHERTVFGLVPEGGLNIGVNITPHLQLVGGYSFLYWNNVVRPGNQISRAINPSQVPSDVTFGTASGPSAPVFNFNSEPFWVHSFNFGLDYRY